MWRDFVVLTLGVAVASFPIWCMRSLAAELRRPGARRDFVVSVARWATARAVPRRRGAVIEITQASGRRRSMFSGGQVAPLLAALGLFSSLAYGQTQTQDPEVAPENNLHSEFIWPLVAAGENNQQRPSQLQQQPAPAEKPLWQYGGFADIGYQHDFNYPSNQLFRSRGTAFKVNEVDLNMAALYLKKQASESSRWGMEVTLQAGKDSEGFGFSATAPNLDGSKWLRHLGPTDVSYLAPIGKGLTFQGGIFPSYIGYDSLYAKDNFNYTRPWGADFTPYLMLGVNAQYPFTGRLTGTLFVISGYWHLAHANNVPSSGGQLAYKATSELTLKETVLYGPHQSDTSLEFWRFLSDSIAEWKGKRLTTAFEYIVGTENVASPGSPRALWMASQLPVHYAVTPRFSVTVRPEVYWDRDGRTTGFRQTVKANTTTFEYRIPYHKASAILWLEHRIDDSRGPEGGFFNDGMVRPGIVGLTPTQNLLSVGVILTFDSSFHH